MRGAESEKSADERSARNWYIDTHTNYDAKKVAKEYAAWREKERARLINEEMALLIKHEPLH